jgi:ATP-dependent Clp protease protease subunit
MRHLPGVLFIVGAQTLPFLLIALRNKSHYVRRACMNYAGEPLMNEDEDDKSKELPIGKETEANLFKSRSIFIYGGITQELAQKVCTQLVALAAASDDDIRVYVNSPGGHVESGDSIHDMIKFIKPKVYIIGTGWVASAGALIYVSVPKERRLCLTNTRFLLHQPSGGTRGMASDIEIQAREIIKMNQRLIKIFSKATGQSEEKIAKDIDRDYWLSAEEAKTYGLVGKIVESQSEL